MHSADERAIWLSTHVLQHEPALRAWLYHKRVVGIETDDIIQDTYARLISVESIDEIRNVRSYMFQTAHSVLVSYVRRSKIVDLQVVSDIDALGIRDDDATPEAHVIGRDELRRLAEAISSLPRRVQDVFVARRIRGMSQREAAKQLGLSENTIEKYMCRSIVLLGSLFLYDGNSATRASNATSANATDREAKRDKKRSSERS
jgi:RNA polymerase sigma-70 factor (ECF subfamily)